MAKKFLEMECKICGLKTQSPSGMSRHVKKHHDYKSFDEYKKEFNIETSLVKIKKQELKNHIDPTNKNQCQICGFVSSSKSPKGLGYHISQNHNISPEEYYDKFYDVELCKHCKINKPKFINVKDGRRDYCKDCLEKSSHPSQDLYWVLKKGAKTLSEIKTMKLEWRKKNHPQYKEYWLLRNYSEDEANKKFHEYRKTHNNVFNLNKRNNFSKISQELYVGIYNKLPEDIKKLKIYFALLNKNKIVNYESLKLHQNYEYLIYFTQEERKIINKNGTALDFFIKELGIVIEFDGTYWHNDKIYEEQRDKIIENKIKDVEIYHVDENIFKTKYQKDALINYFVEIIKAKYNIYRGLIT